MISVCVPTYNGEKYLKAQVDSILSQLSEGDEVVISDDGSSDTTLSILSAYEDERIKIFHHEKKAQKFKFGYTSANVENALLHAQGDIIFMADQDDVWLPGKIEALTDELKHCNLVLSDCSIVDSELGMICKSKFVQDNVKIGVLRNLWKCGYLGCCMAFKREILARSLPIPSNVPHDLWIGITNNKKMSLYPHATMLYRRHDENMSATDKKLLDKQNDNNSRPLTQNQNSLSFKIHYRLIVFFAYIRWYIHSMLYD